MIHWTTDDEFVVGKTAFRLARWLSGPPAGPPKDLPAEDRETALGGSGPAADSFVIVKTKPMIESYLALIDELRPERIFELGIRHGGSTALFALACEPTKLTAIELAEQRLDALDRLVERRGLRERVATYFGVDQSDRGALEQILEREYAGDRLDLVVDDASHLVAPTRVAFNLLFPRLRAGGAYVIEDWSWGLGPWSGEMRPDSQPLAAFMLELLVASASTPGLIDEIVVHPGWACLRRGKLDLDRSTFDVSDCYRERGGTLLPS